MDIETLQAGIAPYAKEQAVILRLLQKNGQFTEQEFDSWFRGREWRRPIKCRFVTEDGFVLGMGANGGTEWAWWLDLVQHMVLLGIISTKTKDEMVVYMKGANAGGNKPPRDQD